MYEAFKSGVKCKPYKMLAKLNEEIVKKVNPQLGETDEYNTSPGLGQGTLEGALLSGNNVDKGVEEYFEDTNCIHYGNIKIKSLLFQDDVPSPQSNL